jgi:hypothetical protein
VVVNDALRAGLMCYGRVIRHVEGESAAAPVVGIVKDDSQEGTFEMRPTGSVTSAPWCRANICRHCPSGIAEVETSENISALI